MSLPFALVGYFLLAAVFALDKFILTKSVTRPVVYTFYSTIFMFGALLAWPFGVEWLIGFDWAFGLGSGIAFGLGLLTMFVAVKGSEASHVNPFIGAVVTIATYLLSQAYLSEELDVTQTVGIILLSVSSLMVSRETTKLGAGWHKAYLLAIVSGFCFAVSHVAAKYIYNGYPFLTGLVWTRAATGLVGLALLGSPAVRSSFTRRKNIQNKPAGRFRAFSLVLGNKILGVVAVVLIQYAMALGSVTVVNALAGAQYVFLFVIVMLLTKLRPQTLREYFTRRELALQIAAFMLLLIGSVMAVK